MELHNPVQVVYICHSWDGGEQNEGGCIKAVYLREILRYKDWFHDPRESFSCTISQEICQMYWYCISINGNCAVQCILNREMNKCSEILKFSNWWEVSLYLLYAGYTQSPSTNHSVLIDLILLLLPLDLPFQFHQCKLSGIFSVLTKALPLPSTITCRLKNVRQKLS